MPRWIALLLWTCSLASARTFVVAAGVEQYDDPGISSLRYAVSDVVATAGSFLSNGVPADQITVLRSDTTDYRQRPTAANVIAALRKVREVAVGDDTLIFVFSGHGVEQDGQVFLLTVDTQRDLMQRTALAMADITATLQGYQGKRVLLVIDACRNDPQAGKGDADAELDETFAKGLRPKLNPTATAPAPDIAVLLACDVGQRAWEMPSEKHGAFTYWLLQGLQGGAASPDGVVHLQALADFVTKQVAAWAERAHREQTPRLDYPGEDFAIAQPNPEATLILTAGRPGTQFKLDGLEWSDLSPAHPQIYRAIKPGDHKLQTMGQAVVWESIIHLDPGQTKIHAVSKTPQDGRPRVVLDVGQQQALLLELRPDMAPQAVARFLQAVDSGFFDGLTFHRVVENFMAQTGDPTTREHNPTPYESWGLPVEASKLAHVRGALALSGSADRKMGPQFYIMFGDNPQLNGTDTVFGKILDDGPEDRMFDSIKQGTRINWLRRLPVE